MSDRPRIRRKDPDRDAPIRDWSNLYRSPGAQVAKPSANGAAMPVDANESTPDGATSGTASTGISAAVDPVSKEARLAIDSAYRVVDEHLQEGRRAAQARMSSSSEAAPGDFTSAAIGSSGIGLAAESVQEMVAQGIRFYASLAPFWASIVSAVANSASVANPTHATGPSAAALAPSPMPRNVPGVPIAIELASARMTRVTIDLYPQANAAKLTTSGLHSIESDRPPLKDLIFAIDSNSNRPVVRIRVPDAQPAGVYSGVIVDADSAEPRGTITLRIEA